MIGTIILSAMLLFAPEPEIITIEIVPVEEIPAVRYEYRPVTNYDWTDSEINEVAKVLWAETGRSNTYAEKQAICCLILNRTMHGHPFKTDIVGVCKQKGEFNRGKASDANRQIARECLDRYQSHLDGNFQQIDFPREAVYMARNNGVLTFYDIDWNKVYEVSK